MFSRGHKQVTKKIFFLFLNLYKALRNSTLGEFAYFRQSRRDEIVATKIEKPRIHILSDVLPAFAVLVS